MTRGHADASASAGCAQGGRQTHVHKSLEAPGGFADVNRRLLLPLFEENGQVLKRHFAPIEEEREGITRLTVSGTLCSIVGR